MLELKTSFHSGVLNIELYGALDALTAPDFKYWLTEKSETGYHYFALNCGGLEYISSRGIGILCELNSTLNGQKHRLVLYHVSNEVLNLLEFLKLSEVIPIVENLRQVYAKLKDISSHKEPVQTTRQTSAVDLVGVMGESEDQMEEEQELVSTFSGEKTSGAGVPPQKVPASVDTGKEEYIDLSNYKLTDDVFDVASMNIVFCPNCGQNLRVTKKGLYLCPDCRTRFNYPFQ
ncbi:MAG: STAS domain-containing protein [Spirochaetia bacterium]|nr:STAS domain-containing protein [Spirochaetia bacterium]